MDGVTADPSDGGRDAAFLTSPTTFPYAASMRAIAAALLLLGCATGCWSEVSLDAPVPKPTERDCGWVLRDSTVLQAREVEILELVPSRSGDTVALVLGTAAEGLRVARWSWSGAAGEASPLAPGPAGPAVVAEGPDDVVAVALRDDWDGPHRLFEEGRGELAELDTVSPYGVRYVGPRRQGGGRPIVVSSGMPGSSLDLYGGEPPSLGLLGCWSAAVSMLGRPGGYLVANVSSHALGSCHPHDDDDRLLEVIQLVDGHRELVHVVPHGPETGTGRAERVRLLETHAGPALLYATQPISYYPDTDYRTRWLLPLTQAGGPAGATVELPFGPQHGSVAATAVGEEVALAVFDDGGVAIQIREHGGTLRRTLTFAHGEGLVGSPFLVSLAANPDADTLVAALTNDGDTVEVHTFTCAL